LEACHRHLERWKVGCSQDDKACVRLLVQRTARISIRQRIIGSRPPIRSRTTSSRGNIGLRFQNARTRLDVSQQRYCVGKGYFFFFLPVFFFALAFLAFLAILPSTIPKLVQCKSFSTRTNVKYTTIAKLIPRVLNKVNGGHTRGWSRWATFFTMHRRDTWT
jgi:hypothetical protein